MDVLEGCLPYTFGTGVLCVCMDKDEFLQQYAQNTSKKSTMDIVYNEFVRYCRKQNLDEDDISTEELEAIARDVVQNGF